MKPKVFSTVFLALLTMGFTFANLGDEAPPILGKEIDIAFFGNWDGISVGLIKWRIKVDLLETTEKWKGWLLEGGKNPEEYPYTIRISESVVASGVSPLFHKEYLRYLHPGRLTYQLHYTTLQNETIERFLGGGNTFGGGSEGPVRGNFTECYLIITFQNFRFEAVGYGEKLVVGNLTINIRFWKAEVDGVQSWWSTFEAHSTFPTEVKGHVINLNLPLPFLPQAFIYETIGIGILIAIPLLLTLLFVFRRRLKRKHLSAIGRVFLVSLTIILALLSALYNVRAYTKIMHAPTWIFNESSQKYESDIVDITPWYIYTRAWSDIIITRIESSGAHGTQWSIIDAMYWNEITGYRLLCKGENDLDLNTQYTFPGILPCIIFESDTVRNITVSVSYVEGLNMKHMLITATVVCLTITTITFIGGFRFLGKALRTWRSPRTQ